LLVGIAVEPNDELNRAVTGATAAASAGNLGLPISLFLVKAAKCFPALRDRRPRLVRAGHIGDEAAGGNWDLTMLRGLAFRHAEAASLFGSGGKVRWRLSASVRQRTQEAACHYRPDKPKGGG
jgi:hypothetical protein